MHSTTSGRVGPGNDPGNSRGGIGRTDGALALADRSAAGGVPLDPVENISTRMASVPGGNSVPYVADSDGAGLLPGHYRRQYLAASRSPDWGGEGSICGGSCLVLAVDGGLRLLPVLCDMWACRLCGPRRAAWLKREVAEARVRHDLSWFWTLTVWTESCTAVESFRLVSVAWNVVRTDLVKAHGRFPYVWTVEPTKRGYAHLHLLTGLAVDRAELSRRWKAATGGSWVVDVQASAGERAANYLAKYVTKQATMRRDPEWQELQGKRAFSKSRDVQFRPFRSVAEEAAGWQVWHRPYWPAAAALRSAGVVLREQVAGVPALVVACPGGLVGGVPACVQGS
jgi:hypothetical protein